MWRSGGALNFSHFRMLRGPNPGLSRDIADRGSGLTESVDLIKDGLPRAAMRLLGEAPMLSDIALIVWARDDRRPAFALIFRWRQ
jgi:hypothetical protein